jgi:hypothetical protein
VFANPAVIRRVNADFVPVFVSPPHSSIAQSDDAEGRLFRSIYRLRVEDQGLCVLNARGQALDWTMMFDDEPSILAFLDHARKRSNEYPAASQPVLTERYRRFPSEKLEPERCDALAGPIPARHSAGDRCPAAAFEAQLPPGTLAAVVIGRALDANGHLSADTIHQEQYAGDRFYIPPDLQEALARACAAATGPVRLPDPFGRLCVMHAYLGQIDVQPLSNPQGGRSDLKQCDFWAEPAGDATRPGLMRVEGRSAVTVEASRTGLRFHHEITLAWEGFIEMKGYSVAHLALSARGTEKLLWDTGTPPEASGIDRAAFLVAGHPIDLDRGVRYGIIGEPLAASDGRPGRQPQALSQQFSRTE